MATVSEIVTDQQIAEYRTHIEELNKLRKEILLAEKAGVKVNWTTKQIDEQIAALQLIINTYQGK